MTRDEAVAKVVKLIRLAEKNSNEHEARSAQEIANKLVQRFQITNGDVQFYLQKEQVQDTCRRRRRTPSPPPRPRVVVIIQPGWATFNSSAGTDTSTTANNRTK